MITIDLRLEPRYHKTRTNFHVQNQNSKFCIMYLIPNNTDPDLHHADPCYSKLPFKLLCKVVVNMHISAIIP